jgi:hypothetical protein
MKRKKDTSKNFSTAARIQSFILGQEIIFKRTLTWNTLKRQEVANRVTSYQTLK